MHGVLYRLSVNTTTFDFKNYHQVIKQQPLISLNHIPNLSSYLLIIVSFDLFAGI